MDMPPKKERALWIATLFLVDLLLVVIQKSGWMVLPATATKLSALLHLGQLKRITLEPRFSKPPANVFIQPLSILLPAPCATSMALRIHR